MIFSFFSTNDFFGWLVVLGFNATLTAARSYHGGRDAHVFPGFLTPVLTQLLFPKPPTTFLICFCRGERRKHAGEKVRLNRGSNSQPPDHESDTLITEPPGPGTNDFYATKDKFYALNNIKFVVCKCFQLGQA